MVLLPNAKQEELSEPPVGNVLVIAPAGCGKTEALSARARAVVARGEVAAPRKILALTYSNKAKDNLASRMRTVVGAGWRQRISVTNFHGLATRVIKAHGRLLDIPSDVLLPEDSWRKRRLRELGVGWQNSDSFDRALREAKSGLVDDDEVMERLKDIGHPEALDFEELLRRGDDGGSRLHPERIKGRGVHHGGDPRGSKWGPRLESPRRPTASPQSLPRPARARGRPTGIASGCALPGPAPRLSLPAPCERPAPAGQLEGLFWPAPLRAPVGALAARRSKVTRIRTRAPGNYGAMEAASLHRVGPAWMPVVCLSASVLGEGGRIQRCVDERARSRNAVRRRIPAFSKLSIDDNRSARAFEAQPAARVSARWERRCASRPERSGGRWERRCASRPERSGGRLQASTISLAVPVGVSVGRRPTMAMLSQEQNGNKALRTPKVVKEFKAFVLRGNVVDLAVGVVMGAAFATVVGSLVKNVITPVTGVFGKLPKFEDLSVPVGRSELVYGAFINDLLSFLIVGMVVFFFVVKPLNRLLAVTQDCPECLSSIPKGARRCMYCGEAVPSLVTDSAEGSRQ